jgi:hypothetical protein
MMDVDNNKDINIIFFKSAYYTAILSALSRAKQQGQIYLQFE